MLATCIFVFSCTFGQINMSVCLSLLLQVMAAPCHHIQVQGVAIPLPPRNLPSATSLLKLQ